MKLTEQEIIKLRKILFELSEISEEKWEQLLILLDSDGENFGTKEIRFVTEIGIPLIKFIGGKKSIFCINHLK